MQCNIDAKGRAARLVLGFAVVLVGLLLIVLSLIGVLPQPWVMWAGIFTALGGVFPIYEGWAGWCALRAMGIRTKI